MAFGNRLNQTLSCATPVPLIAQSIGRERYSLTFRGAKRFVLLPGAPLLISVAHDIEVYQDVDRAHDWYVRSVSYAYDVNSTNPNRAKVVVQFHWHPEISGTKDYHHIHVETPLAPIDRKKHIPGGRVPLEVVIRWLIEEMGAAHQRDDWDDVLTRNQAYFNTIRTR